MTQRLITVGHSPDPDDAFMFYALAHDKLDTGNLRFRHELQDIETLNRRALRGELEVTAVSIHAYAHLLDRYALLPSGCSMGDRYGPMVVARRPLTIEQLHSARIAVPGTLTTAFLALRLLLPVSLGAVYTILRGIGGAATSPRSAGPLRIKEGAGKWSVPLVATCRPFPPRRALHPPFAISGHPIDPEAVARAWSPATSFWKRLAAAAWAWSTRPARCSSTAC